VATYYIDPYIGFQHVLETQSYSGFVLFYFKKPVYMTCILSKIYLFGNGEPHSTWDIQAFKDWNREIFFKQGSTQENSNVHNEVKDKGGNGVEELHLLRK